MTTADPNVHYADPNAPMRILIHGEPGSGRRSLCAQAPNPVFLCLDRNPPPSDVPCWNVEQKKEDGPTLEEVVLAVRKIATTSSEFKTLVVHTTNALEQIMIEDIEQELRATAERNGEGPETFSEYNDENRGGGYDLLASRWKSLLQQFDAIQRARHLHVVLISDTRYDTAFGGLDPRDQRAGFSRATIDAGGQKATALLKRWAEYMLFIDSRPVEIDEWVELPDGSKRRSIERVRFINCTQLPEIDAHCGGAARWPDFIEYQIDNGFDWFFRNAMLIRKYGKQLPSRLRAALKEAMEKVDAESGRALSEAFKRAVEQFDYAGAKQLLSFATSVSQIGE